LSIATSNPPADNWSELVAQPDPPIHADGFYDALSTTGGIPAGNHVAGFAVTFDWLGTGLPGAQRFDIVDPANFAVRFSATTIPEPSTILLVAMVLPLFLARALWRRTAFPQDGNRVGND